MLSLLTACQVAPTSNSTKSLGLDFSLLTLDSDTLQLVDYRGDVVVLNFWATWCRPCVEEIPELITLHRDVDGLTVLGIALDGQDTERVSAFAENMAIPYPILIANQEVIEQVGGVWAVPTTIVLDTTGMVTDAITGIAPIEAMTPRLREMTLAHREPLR